MTHEQLWAPWRLAYISTNKDRDQRVDDCFLCRYLADDKAHDAENFIVTRGPHSLTVLNRFPYNNGHLLIAPAQHKANLEDLGDDELLDCMRQLQQMAVILKKTISPDGFNIGLNLGTVAGAGLPGHLHWHLVPRWNGDTSFMPVLGDVNVIPQSLSALYTLLKTELEA